MIKRDFHGYKVEEAVRAVEDIIGQQRIKNTVTKAEFITGHGVIQKELLALCEEYGLEAHVSWANTGVICVTIE
jgi:hypothetical protein